MKATRWLIGARGATGITTPAKDADGSLLYEAGVLA